MYATDGGPGAAVVLLIGMAVLGLVAGLIWIRKVTSAEDDGPSSWRSHR